MKRISAQKEKHNLTHSFHTQQSKTKNKHKPQIEFMEIPEKLLKFRYHLAAALLLGVTLFSVATMGPRLVTLLAYFWPLLLSTALVLALVFVFAKTSPLPPTDTSLHKGLLDYVAGHHEPPLDAHNKSD